MVVAGTAKVCRRIAQVGGEQAIVLDDYSAFRASEFDATRIAGIHGGGCLQSPNGTVGEFESCHERVFSFDLVQGGFARGLNSDHVAEKPKQQVNGMNGLIDQGTSAIQ